MGNHNRERRLGSKTGIQDIDPRIITKTKNGEHRIRNDKDGEKEREKYDWFPKQFDRMKKRRKNFTRFLYSVSETFGKYFKNVFAVFSLAVVVGLKGVLMELSAL